MSPANDVQNAPAASCGCSQVLAIASVPMQPFVAPSELSLALKRGTLFENLYFPFFAGGDE